MESFAADAKQIEGSETSQCQNKADAVAKLTAAIESDPTNPVYFSERSDAYFAWGKFQEAAADAAQCIQLDSNYVEGYRQHGVALKELKQYTKALETVRAGQRVDPSDPQLAKLAIKLESLQESDQQTGDSGARVAQQLATGAAVGAGVGSAAAAAVVPVVNAIGFTAQGIAAGSTAAGMMASSAVASGGGVAAGSSVAVLQSIGAVGLAAGPVAAIVVSGVALGAGTAAVLKCFRSGQAESVSTYEPDHGTGKHWVIATKEGWGDVRTCRYASESEAREVYPSIWCAKILYDPEGREVESGGMSPFGVPHQTIRQVMSQL